MKNNYPCPSGHRRSYVIGYWLGAHIVWYIVFPFLYAAEWWRRRP